MIPSLRTLRPQNARIISRRTFCSPNKESLLTYGMVKRALQKDTFTTKMFAVITLTAGVVSTIFVIKSSNQSDEEVAMAVTMLNREELEIKEDGFKILRKAVLQQKRTFSGLVGLIAPPTVTANPELIASLLENVSSNDRSISQESLSWLLRLSSSNIPAASKVKSEILKLDPNFTAISSLLTSEDYGGSNDLWIKAANLVLNFNKHELSFVRSRTDLANSLTTMVKSGDPIALSLAVKIYEKLSMAVPLEPEVESTMKNIVGAMEKYPIRYGSLAPPNVELLHTVPPTANPLSIALFSILAAGWGRVLWSLSARMSPAYQQVTARNVDSASAEAYKNRFLKSRKVGTAVLLLCVIDYACTRALQNRCLIPPEQKTYDFSMGELTESTTIPLAQIFLMTFGTLLAVKTQRFVLVPLFVIGGFNNYDLFFNAFTNQHVLIDQIVQGSDKQIQRAKEIFK